MKPTLVLIRGLPGSGKTTLAKAMTGYRHFEADDYFMVDGIYCFKREALKAAHAWCQSESFKSLAMNLNVVVSNTFTRRWEMQPYIDFAEKHAINLAIIPLYYQFQNIHNVPQEAINDMLERWED